MPASPPKVSLRNIRKFYPGPVEAVKNLNLDIHTGEFLVLVGPSGCGKSTLLRMIAGLETITAGDLHIAGKRANDQHPKDRDIAMVFQDYALYPHMTVFENLAFGLRLRHERQNPNRALDAALEFLTLGYWQPEIPGLEQNVRSAAATLGIENLLDRKPAQLSGGQRQRVAMGRAIVRHPQVFLFDEPLSNLDARLRVEMRIELARLHRRLGATIVYVTHDQIEAMTLGQRVVVMNNGQIHQVDTPTNLYDHPTDRFVATFIGSPVMSIFPGRVTAENGHPLFHRGQDFTLELPSSLVPYISRIPSGIDLGIRPEHIQVLSAAAPATPGLIAGKAQVVEQFGDYQIVIVQSGATEFTARAPADLPIAPGTPLHLRLATDRIHLFHPDTGANLNSKPQN